MYCTVLPRPVQKKWLIKLNTNIEAWKEGSLRIQIQKATLTFIAGYHEASVSVSVRNFNVWNINKHFS